MLSARSAVIWACRKVVVGAPGPFGIGRYCSSCSPAAAWTALERFQQGDNFIAFGRGEDLPALIHERELLIQHDVDMEQGAAYMYGMVFNITDDCPTRNFLKPLPGETVAALTRDISTSSPA
jgi:hypothetical protein